MSFKSLPKSLIDSVVSIANSRISEKEALKNKLIGEGLRKFGVKKISQLTEIDYKAMYSWVQTKLAEAECHCNDIDIEESSVMKIPGFPNWTARIESEGDDGGNVSDVMYKGKFVGKVEFDYIADAFWIRVGTHQKAFNSWAEVIAHFKTVNNIRESKKLREDDMPNDEVYHKSGENSEKKFTLGEDSAEEIVKAELDKMGKTLGELSPEEKKNLFNKVDSLVKAKNEESEKADKDYDGDGEVESGSDEYLGSRDKAIKSAMNESSEKTYTVVNKSNPKETYTIKAETDFEMLEKIAKKKLTVDNLKTYIDFFKKNYSYSISESIAFDPDEVATNKAVAVGSAMLADPIHADIIRDAVTTRGSVEYRLLLQYATGGEIFLGAPYEGTHIYPPPSMPGAASIEMLRDMIEGMPFYNKVVEKALERAIDLPSKNPMFVGNDKQVTESKKSRKKVK